MEKEKSRVASLKSALQTIFYTLLFIGVVVLVRFLALEFAIVRYGLLWLSMPLFCKAAKATHSGIISLVCLTPLLYLWWCFLFGFHFVNHRIAEHYIWCIICSALVIYTCIAHDVEKWKNCKSK